MAALEETLKKNGILVYTDKGDSMMPLLRENKDLMIIRTLSEPPKKSDAVLFKRPNGALVLHRIVKANKDGSYMTSVTTASEPKRPPATGLSAYSQA